MMVYLDKRENLNESNIVFVGFQKVVKEICIAGGAGEARTPDLLTASQTFSQLNYSPADTLLNLAKNNRKRKLNQYLP